MRRLALLILLVIILAALPVREPGIPTRVIAYIPQPKDVEVTMVAVGDIMLSRTVAKRMREYGADYPFASTTAYTSSADITFGNLETSITPGVDVQPFQMDFRADPDSAEALKRAGFDILSLANNHTPNFGAEGILDTLDYLDSASIKHAGAGADAFDAAKPAYITVKGITFAFLAYNDSDVVPDSYEAMNNHPGTAFMHIDRMQSAVQDARMHADIVIVSMHSGIEYQPLPDDRQKAFAHAAIDAGADIVIGHHPHVVETAEVYKGRYIFYSLGNFIFDQMFSQDVRHGMTLDLVFTKKGLKSLAFQPILIEDYAQPHLLEGPEAASVIERLGVDRGL